MSVASLITELKKANLQIRLGDNGQLKVYASHGIIPDELREKISKNKSELVVFLNDAYYSQQHKDGEIARVKELPYYEVSHAQKRLWVIDQFEKEDKAMNFVPNAHFIKGPLDHLSFKKAWETILERHETLRTVFLNIDGLPKQKILEKLPEDFYQYIDLRGEVDAHEKAEAIAEEENNTCFDLGVGPLVRVKLIRIEEEKHLFLFTLHHIIADGWSNMVLHNELITLYDAFSRNNPNPFEPLKIQYKDFVYWQNEKMVLREEKYWLDKLSGGLTYINLPFDFEEEESYNGKSMFRTIEKETFDQLKQMAADANRSLSHVAFTVFNIFLKEISGQEELIVGVAAANRNHPELEKLIGFFINTLVIRSHISDDMEFDKIFDHVTSNLIEAHEHQDYPFDLLVEKLNPERVSKKQPLFNVMYSFQSFNDVHLNMGSGLDKTLDLGQVMDDHSINTETAHQALNKAYFDLTTRIVDQGETLLLELEYNADLFEEDTIESLFDVYEDSFLMATPS